MGGPSLSCNFIFGALLLLEIIWACEATGQTLRDASMAEILHQQWMARFGRTYKDDADKAKRLEIFKENLKYIDSFNSLGNRTYKLGINEFTDMTNQEFMAAKTGYKIKSHQNSSTAISSSNFSSASAPGVNVGEVPPQVDWREKGAVTDVKNQQQCGCCWAFSAVAAIEGLIQITTGNLVSLSEQQLVDCDTINNGGCKLGGTMEKAFEFIVKNNGLTNESNYPYQGVNGTCKTMMESSAQITGYEGVPANDESALKAAVANQPVSVAVDSTQFQFYSTGVFTEECGTNLNHALTVVGYGETEDGMKYWLVKNSWGNTWGESGYMRILRDAEDPRGQCGIAMYASYPTA